MFRKALYLILALLACGLIVAVIDGVRHAMAINRLESHGAMLDDWQYRLIEEKVESPPVAGHKVPLLTWLQRMVSTPRAVSFTSTTFDHSLARAVAVVGVEDLSLDRCVGLSHGIVTELCFSGALQKLTVNECDLTDEGINIFWSHLPELDFASITRMRLSEEGFRDIGRAQKLSSLFLEGKDIGDRVVARVHEAPSLGELRLWDVGITEESASPLATMPSLWSVNFLFSPTAVKVAERLRALNPKLKVEVFSLPTALRSKE
jgi:hypothetical protein